MTKLVAQSVINSFFDGKHADPFAVLGMHETHNGIEIRALLPDADKVEVIDKESQSIVVELEKWITADFLLRLCRIFIISLPTN